jgi:hypothetical protein
MVTAEQVDQIKILPKRQQGEHIDAALDSLMANGRTMKDAAAELAEALDTGVKPNSLIVAYYRRRKEAGKPKHDVRVSTSAPTPEVARATRRRRATSLPAADNGSLSRVEAHSALLLAIGAYADAVARERLAEIRKALG